MSVVSFDIVTKVKIMLWYSRLRHPVVSVHLSGDH